MVKSSKYIKGWQFHDPDVDYLTKMIKLAPQYDISHIQLCHNIIIQIGQVYTLESTKRAIEVASELAFRRGIDTYCWSVEMSFVPDEYIRDGKLDFDKDELWKWFEDQYRNFFTDFPKVKGVVLSFGDMSHYHIYDDFEVITNLSKKDRIKRVLDIVYRVCKEYDKDLIVRDWAGGQVVLEVIQESPKDIKVMTKTVIGDWSPTDPHNPNIGKFEDRDLLIEFDLGGEYEGRSWIPWCVPQNIKYRWNHARQFPNVIGGVGRIDVFDAPGSRIYCLPITTVSPLGVNHAYDTANAVNMYAFSKILDDPSINVDVIWNEWATHKYGTKAAPYVISALKRTWDIVNLLLWRRQYLNIGHYVPQLAYLERTAEEEGYLGHKLLEDFIEEQNAMDALEEFHKPIEDLCNASLADIDECQQYLTEEEYKDLRYQIEMALLYSDVWKQMYKTFIRYEIAHRYPSPDQNKLLSLDLDKCVKLANYIDKKYGADTWPSNPMRIRYFIETIRLVQNYYQKQALRLPEREDLVNRTLHMIKWGK